VSYRGLTWDHPRGYVALEAAARQWGETDGVEIAWERQPLEGFESHPIADLCGRYDIIVLDHPHLGEAVAAGVLQPLDAILGPATMADIARHTVGACLSSYKLDGQHWALPLDAASQVMALRPDLLDGPVPVLWSEVGELSRRTGRVPLSLAGPHALLTLTSMALAFGDQPGASETYLADTPGRQAIELFYELAALSPASCRDDNPIGLLERLSGSTDIVLAPLVFGYVTYAGADRAARLAFHNPPRVAAGGPLGSVLGGTGIALTGRCRPTDGLVVHLRRLLGSAAQVEFIPNHAGQPSRRAAWTDQQVNADWGQFYAQTLQTLEQAYVRPRHNGYMQFQQRAAELVRDAAIRRPPSTRLIDALNQLYAEHRPSRVEEE